MFGKYEIYGWVDKDLIVNEVTDSWFEMKLLVWRTKRVCNKVLLTVNKRIKGF